MTLTIGDSTRNGLYQITDTTHPSIFDGGPNDLRVTVRELYGYSNPRNLSRRDVRAMRDLARRAVENPVSAIEVNRFYSQGCVSVTCVVRGDEVAE